MKFGSLGEYEIKAIKSKIPKQAMIIPLISINLLIIKVITELANFLYPYLMNQI